MDSPLVIRVPKTSPELSRGRAAEIAREIAIQHGHPKESLRRSKSRIERDGEGWVYVIEFPDHQ